MTLKALNLIDNCSGSDEWKHKIHIAYPSYWDYGLMMMVIVISNWNKNKVFSWCN